MIIRKAVIFGFGHLINCEFEPDKKGILNVTKGLISDTDLFFEFVRTMLYGHSLRNGVSTRTLYMPDELIDSRGKKVLYGGELVYDACGRTYRLSCLYGATKQDDVYRIIDTVTGRDVKIEIGRTVGEKTLRISEGAFISAARDFGYEPEAKENGILSLGKLSALLGVFDGHPSPKEFKTQLNAKLKSLTNSRTKKGSFDILVIKKMSMRNTLTRFSDRDQKLLKLRHDLEHTEKELSAVNKEIDANKRIYGLCDAARTLLNKDKIMTLYDQILSIMRQYDYIKEEHNRAKKANLFLRMLKPLLFLIGGAFIIGLGSRALKGTFLGLPFEIIGTGAAFFGILYMVVTAYKFAARFSFKIDGRTTTYADEEARLEAELEGKNSELLEILSGESAGEIMDRWRESEDVMRDARDSERRFAVMKQVYDLEAAMTSLKSKKKPLTDKIDAIRSEINALTSGGDSDFSEACYELFDIDNKISKLQNEIEAVKIALAAAETAESRFLSEVAGPVARKAEEIYFKTSGETASFDIDSDYNVTAVCSDKELAMLSVRGALSSFASSESDRQLMFIGDKAGEKDYLDRFMRASGIGQLVIVSRHQTDQL